MAGPVRASGKGRRVRGLAPACLVIAVALGAAALAAGPTTRLETVSSGSTLPSTSKVAAKEAAKAAHKREAIPSPPVVVAPLVVAPVAVSTTPVASAPVASTGDDPVPSVSVAEPPVTRVFGVAIGVVSPAPDPSDDTARRPGPRGGSPSSPDATPTTAPSSSTTTIRPPPSTTPPSTTTLPSTTTTTSAPPSTTTTQPATTTTTKPPAPVTLYVFDGQSNSRYPNRDLAYPAVVMREGFPGAPSVVVAISGSSYLERTADAQSRVDGYGDDRDRQTLFTEGGQTDLARGASGAELFQRVKTYVAGRRAAGFDLVVGMTIPPSTWFSPAQDAERLAFNDLLRARRADAGLDILVDIAADPRLQDPSDTRYYADGVHYTAEAAAIVARAALRAMGH